ncbi:MAG: hypothetical protein Q4C86_08345, partial [bacterium]|nr:hypothetical protein [bacterium]
MTCEVHLFGGIAAAPKTQPPYLAFSLTPSLAISELFSIERGDGGLPCTSQQKLDTKNSFFGHK